MPPLRFLHARRALTLACLALSLILPSTGLLHAQSPAAPAAPATPAAPTAPTTPSTPATPTLPIDGSYILRAGDNIRLEVYEEPDLSTNALILKTGEVSFPLIGNVKIDGLSVTAATTKIRDLLQQDYLVDPKVTLSVVQYATDYISVIGAVRSPGQVPISNAVKLDLATAMATVGGLSDTADPSQVVLIRGSGTQTVYRMSDITNGASGRVELRAGDRIIVNQSPYLGKTVTVLGQVGRPGPLQFPLSGQLDLVQAIAGAGGFTGLANQRKISINRGGKTTMVDYKDILDGNKPVRILPDDVINVPERIF